MQGVLHLENRSSPPRKNTQTNTIERRDFSWNVRREIGTFATDHCEYERVLISWYRGLNGLVETQWQTEINFKFISKMTQHYKVNGSLDLVFKYCNFYSSKPQITISSEIYTLQRHVEGEPLESAKFNVRARVLSQFRLRSRQNHFLQVLVLRSDCESVHMDRDRYYNLIRGAASGRIPGQSMWWDSGFNSLPFGPPILKPDLNLFQKLPSVSCVLSHKG